MSYILQYKCNARIHCITFYSICRRNCAHELGECRTEINADAETNHTETIETAPSSTTTKKMTFLS